jgi:hypothetical protein
VVAASDTASSDTGSADTLDIEEPRLHGRGRLVNPTCRALSKLVRNVPVVPSIAMSPRQMHRERFDRWSDRHCGRAPAVVVDGDEVLGRRRRSCEVRVMTGQVAASHTRIRRGIWRRSGARTTYRAAVGPVCPSSMK